MEPDPDLGAAAGALLGAGVEPLAGGYSGETFLLHTPQEDVVLRVYGRAPARAAVDAALLGMLGPLLPVPRVLDLQVGSDGRPSHLVTERLPGVRLDLALPGLTVAARARAGRELGEVLARLACMPFVRRGLFRDETLAIDAWAEGTAENVGWLEQHLDRPWFAAQPLEVRDGLLALADRADALWDGRQRACLVHGDFNPKNLLVDPESGALRGVLDWEYAHAGLPYADLGNLRRLRSDPVLQEAVTAAYEEQAPALDGDWPALAEAADLVALVELAGRQQVNPVVEQVRELLLRRSLTSADGTES